jgi:hypothetical protein
VEEEACDDRGSSGKTSKAKELDDVRVNVNLSGPARKHQYNVLQCRRDILGLGRSCSQAGTDREEVEPISEAMVGGLEFEVAVESIDFYDNRHQ